MDQTVKKRASASQKEAVRFLRVVGFCFYKSSYCVECRSRSIRSGLPFAEPCALLSPFHGSHELQSRHPV